MNLTSYTELASVLASLPVLLKAERRRRGLSVRAAAREMGMSFATVSRIEEGRDCALSNAMTVLRWLAGAAEQPGPQNVPAAPLPATDAA